MGARYGGKNLEQVEWIVSDAFTEAQTTVSNAPLFLYMVAERRSHLSPCRSVGLQHALNTCVKGVIICAIH